MALSEVDFPYSYYPDPTKGRPVFNGFLYFGQPNTDPEIESNQVDVFALTDGTTGDPVQIAQPVSTNAGGVPTYNGSVVSLFIDGDYSVKVLDKNRQQVYFAQNKGARLTKGEIGSYTNYEFDTVSNAQNGITIGGQTVTLKENDVIRIKERDSKIFDVIDGVVGVNGFDVIADSSNTLSFSMRDKVNVSLKALGGKGDNSDETDLLVFAFSGGRTLHTGKRTDVYRLEHSTLFANTGLNYVPIGSNMRVEGEAVFTINSNQVADGTRYEVREATNVYIGPVRFVEVNSVLTRSNVYAPICANDSTNFVFDRVEVDGANGAGMHFRRNCRNFILNQPNIRNTKADGMNIQRGTQNFVINEPDIALVEDDCIGVVGHGRTEGFDRAGFGAIYCGKEMGFHANGAVGSGIALVGCTNMDVYNLRAVNCGLSGVRIQAFVDAVEGNYTAQNIRVINPYCESCGITTDPSSGLLKDGISIGNSSNVQIINPTCVQSVNSGISVSDSNVDLKIVNAKCFRSGFRGVWVASSSQSSSWAMELWQDDPRKGGATTVENHFLKILGCEVDYSGVDGFYMDGTASQYLKDPEFRNIIVKRSNINNTTGVYGCFFIGMESPLVDSFDGGSSGSATALQSAYAFVLPLTGYTIKNAASRVASNIVPFDTEGGLRRFWNGSFPGAATGIDGGYIVGDEIHNFNPGSGVKLWTCTSAGDPGTWVASNIP